MVSCAHKVTVISGRGDEAFVRQWLDRLVGLNKRLYAFNAEPYFVRGFNLECWLDVSSTRCFPLKFSAILKISSVKIST